jgi:hypothetical protein
VTGYAGNILDIKVLRGKPAKAHSSSIGWLEPFVFITEGFFLYDQECFLSSIFSCSSLMILLVVWVNIKGNIACTLQQKVAIMSLKITEQAKIKCPP